MSMSIPNGGTSRTPQAAVPPQSQTADASAANSSTELVTRQSSNVRLRGATLPAPSAAQPPAHLQPLGAGALQAAMQAVREAVAAQGRPASHMPRNGFRPNYDPHQFLARLQVAANQPLSQIPAAGTPNMSPQETTALCRFVASIPQLTNHRNFEQDEQSVSLAMLSTLIRNMTLSDASKLQLAEALSMVAGGVTNIKHTHPVGSEIASSTKRNLRGIKESSLTTKLVLGAMLPLSLVSTASAVAGEVIVRTVKEDKGTNKALKILGSLIRALPQGQLGDRLVNQATQLLVAAPDPNKTAVVELAKALNRRATDPQKQNMDNALPADRAFLRTV